MADKETLPVDYTKYRGLSSRRAHKTLRGAIRKLLRDEQAKYNNYSRIFAGYWFSRPITWLYILTCGLLLTYYFFADAAEQIRTIVEFCLVSTFFLLNSLLTYFNKLALCVGRIRRARAHLKAFRPERDPLLTMSQDEMARQASNRACDYQRVRRDGQWQLLPAALLVEGDLVLLAVNQHAPARVTSLHYSDVELQAGELVTVEPFQMPSSPPSADHVGRDWSPWRVLETPILSTLAQTFAAGPDLPLELIPPALSRALWVCGLTSLAVSVIHSVVRVAVLEHQRALWPWLFMQRNAFLLLPILGITVPALEWIITCLQNARLWALFHTQQQTPVTARTALDDEHVLNIDHEPSAKYEEVPGALVKDYFDHFMRGDSSVLSRYSRLIHVLGHATTLCVIDKEGILSETIPYPEKLCVFNDEESVVLALERQQRNSIRFVSENWEEYLPALKPLGLNAMLNSSCKSRARQHRDRALDSPSHVFDHVPFISEHNKCLYLLGREIGFTDAVIENYIHLNETHIYHTQSVHHLPGQGLNGGNSIDSQYQSIIALLVQDIASESLQLLSRGSPEFVLDVCQQYWNGESLNRMNDQIRNSITRLYTQWGVNVDYHCICFSYKPIDRRFKMLFKERGVLLSSEIGQSAVVDDSESSGTTVGTRKSSEIKKRNKKLKIEAIKNKRKEKSKKGTSSSFDVFGLKKKSRDKKKKDRASAAESRTGDVSEHDEPRDMANNSTASPRDSASEGPDEREGRESESRDQARDTDQQSRDQQDKSASDSVPPDHVTDQHDDSASTPRALPRIAEEDESSEHAIDAETSAEQPIDASAEQLMEASASRVIDESSRMETEFTEREDESDLTASYKQALYDQTLLGMAAVRYLPRDSVPQLIEELMDASIRFVHFSRVNEQRTKLFADKLGLETDWNCCISLQEHAVAPGPTSEIAPTSPGSAIEKLPHGIEKIKRHIREVDNVPLLVKMFSDATPQNTMEMIDILQQNGEVCVVLGSALQLQHQHAFMAADLSISLMPERVSDCSGDTEPDQTPRDPIDTSRDVGDRTGDQQTSPFTYSSVSSTQFKEHKTSGTLAVDLNSLPCDLIFKSDTNLFDIYELFRAGRHLLSNTTQALLLLLGAQLALHYLMLISALVYVPPALNGIHLLWLIVVITPLLSLCLLWAPLEPKIMKQIAPKNLPIKTRRLFRYLGYFVARAIPSVLVCVVIYIWVLQLTWTTFDTRVIYGTALPADFDWSNYFQALHFSQNVTLYAFVLYLVVTSLTCHHRNLSLKVVNPFMNRPWVIGVPITLVLQTAFFVISLREDLSLLSQITWPVWLIIFGWLPLLIATHEGIKRIDLNDYIRQQTIMKLEFNTKLGMHSPI